jgi:hypothetical protein
MFNTALKELGPSFMMAYEVYREQADQLFNMAIQNKSHLKEASKAYKIAGLNALTIMKLPEAEALKAKLSKGANDCITFAEQINKKVQEDPLANTMELFMSQYNQIE